jgi:hypothetical protein
MLLWHMALADIEDGAEVGAVFDAAARGAGVDAPGRAMAAHRTGPFAGHPPTKPT